MRKNKYLYIVPLDIEHAVLFNGINKEFLVINSDAVNSFVQLLQSPDSYYNSHKTIISYLKTMGFILEDQEDERKYLIDFRHRFMQSKEYKTTILPTYECNYNCWYCIQKHESVKMDLYKIKLIVKHVKKYLLANEIESYVLSWFGGEPLTQPQIIDAVSKELRLFCAEKHIEFSASVTTNGALLNSENIRMLARNDVNYYQIAIDGDEKNHNLNKHDKNSESSFRLILTNIVNLLQINSNAQVVLRLNYTLATLKSPDLLNDICKYLPLEYRRRITVDLQKVWQIKEETVKIELLKKLQEELVLSGFELSTEHVFSMCYVEKEHYNMFFYNGGVEKCDKRAIDDLRGYLDSDGNIVWKEKPIFQDYDLFDESCVCSQCLYYPLCYCGCPVLREDRINENNGKIICGHCGDYSIFENRIQDYCWRVLNNKKIEKKYDTKQMV